MEKRKTRVVTAAFLATLIVLALSWPAFSKTYYLWTDPAGTVHITDNEALAPEDHQVFDLPERPPAEPDKPAPPPVIKNIIVVPGEVDDEKDDRKGPVVPEAPKCKPLDVREFGLISTSPVDPWHEVTLVEKFGPPCQVIHLGDVFTERGVERLERDPVTGVERRVIRSGGFAERKQYVYWGSYTHRTTVITIVGGVVVAKERLYD